MKRTYPLGDKVVSEVQLTIDKESKCPIIKTGYRTNIYTIHFPFLIHVIFASILVVGDDVTTSARIQFSFSGLPSYVLIVAVLPRS